MPDTPQPPAAESRFTRRVGSFTVGTLLSRIFGVVRESVFAWLFGANAVTDAFNVAFRIPNVLRDLFAESALSAAFVPTFVTSLRTRSREETWRFGANMVNVIALAIGVAVLAGIAFAPAIVKVIAFGFREYPAQLDLTTHLTRVMFPFLVFVALAAAVMGMLNATGSFFISAAAPAAFNIVSASVAVIACTYLPPPGLTGPRLEVWRISTMAWGVTIGAVAQLLAQYPALRRHGFRWQPFIDFKDPRLREVFRRWLPMLLGLGTWQVNFMVNTFLLTFLPEGSVTWVNYAYRIQHLPAGLFGVAVGSVALAEYSHAAAGGGTDIRDRFRHAMNLVSVLTLPAALLLLSLAVPVTRIIYQHGRFTPDDTVLTAQALALYCLGIWSAAATRNCAAGFYAKGDTKTPAFVALAVVAANIVLNLILMRSIGFLSFPLSASITQTANVGLLFLILRRRTGGLHGRAIALLGAKTLACALAAAGSAYGLNLLLERLLPPAGFLPQAVDLLVAGATGVGVYFLLARLLGIAEVGAAFRDLVGTRLGRKQANSDGPTGV